MANGGERLLEQTRHINGGIATRNFKTTQKIINQVNTKETSSHLKVFLSDTNSKTTAILKKQYPSTGDSSFLISRASGQLHSIYLPQSEVCVKKKEERNSTYKFRITTTYPPTYDEIETLCIFSSM